MSQARNDSASPEAQPDLLSVGLTKNPSPPSRLALLRRAFRDDSQANLFEFAFQGLLNVVMLAIAAVAIIAGAIASFW